MRLVRAPDKRLWIFSHLYLQNFKLDDFEVCVGTGYSELGIGLDISKPELICWYTSDIDLLDLKLQEIYPDY